MDFDDLLFNTNILMRDFPDVLLKYQSKFRYILVDEYQDTNFSQYVIIKQLAARFENICVVGDDAQSIYAFRGANIQNILNFEKDYPDLKTFKLEQNYRSTQTIVNAANSVIEKNKDQFRKTVWTSNETGEKIRIIRANSDNEEGLKVASSIWELRMQNQLSNQSFAILYRTNAQSRSMEEALRKLNIPYKIYGGVSFYQRKEIKDLLAYFRLTINRNDDESLRRIINYPARGIGNTTMDKIEVAAAEHDVSLWTVIENLKDFQLSISSGTLTKIGDFVSMMKSFSLLSPFKDAFETANQIASGSGILKDLYNDKSPEGVSRYENIQELLNGIKDFTDTQRTPQEDELKDSIKVEVNPADLFHAEVSKEFRTLDEFMQEISLMTDADTEKEDEKDLDKVSLMTIHAAKGLEFPFVYIVGLEENLFPSQLSLQSRSDLEEERRLFYVAITRAEKRATISYAATRYRFGSLIYCEPSRFIDELDPKYLDFPEPTVQSKFGSSTFDKIKGNFKPNEKPIGFKKKNEEEIKGFNPKRKLISIPKNNSNANSGTSFSPSGSSDSNTLIRAGVVVSHDKFGRGTVLNVEGESPNLKATIQFESHGQKMLLLKYAQLRVIS
jgi:DNA helicase-2/ATP-dependent DNA helicase PcrA